MKRNTVLELTFGWLGAPFYLGSIVLSLWTYFWAIGIAFNESGLIAAFFTFAVPILSQLFWAYKSYQENGIDSLFVTLSLVMLGCIIISTIFVHYSAKYANK